MSPAEAAAHRLQELRVLRRSRGHQDRLASTSTLAFLFPGQGAQFVGMARDLIEEDASARETVLEVESRLKLPLRQLMLDGPEESLRRTEHAQPAIVLHSLLLLRALVNAKVEADAVAGHSLGEFSGLHAAGSLEFWDTLAAVKARGAAMAAGAGAGTGMAAVLGLSDQQVDEILAAQVGPDRVVAANYNAPGQVVISGADAGLARVTPALEAAGARRIVRLEVSAAFHSPLMRGAASAFSRAWEAIPLHPAVRLQVFNADAQIHQDTGEIRALMVNQLLSPVRWTGCVRKLWELGVRTFVEVGPKRTLTALVKKIQPQASTHNVEDLVTLRAFLEAVHA